MEDFIHKRKQKSLFDLRELKQLLNITEDNPKTDLLKDMLSLYISSTKEYTEQINKSFEARAFHKVSIGAHTLKSSLAQINANYLELLAKQIEYICKDDTHHAELERLIADFTKGVDLLLSQLTNELIKEEQSDKVTLS